MGSEPVNLDAALASFDALWSPRVAGRVNEFAVKIAKVKGDFVWHAHEDTDEFFMVLDGEFDIALREPGEAERTVQLRTGDIFVVPRGVEHRPTSPGASIMMFELATASNTGNAEGEIPDHIDSTTGRDLATSPS
jgi:mannose-6-phosphate isomerase-like protein (cupin superfamily)